MKKTTNIMEYACNMFARLLGILMLLECSHVPGIAIPCISLLSRLSAVTIRHPSHSHYQTPENSKPIQYSTSKRTRRTCRWPIESTFTNNEHSKLPSLIILCDRQKQWNIIKVVAPLLARLSMVPSSKDWLSSKLKAVWVLKMLESGLSPEIIETNQ